MQRRNDYDVQGYEAVDSAGQPAGVVTRAVTETGSPRIRELQITGAGGPPLTVGPDAIRHIDDLGRKVVLRRRTPVAAGERPATAANAVLQLGVPVQSTTGDVLGTVAEVTENRFKIAVPLAHDRWLPISAITGRAPGGDLVVSDDGDERAAPAGGC